jgi:hypothetical protein
MPVGRTAPAPPMSTRLTRPVGAAGAWPPQRRRRPSSRTASMRSPQDFCASDPPVRDHPLGLRGGLAQLLALRLRRGARRGDLVLEVGPGLGPRLRRAGLRLLRTRRELRQLVRERHCSSFFQPFPERRASRPESTLHRLPQCLAAGWVTGRHAFLVIDRTTGIAVGSARVEPVTPASLRFTGSPARGPHPVRHGPRLHHRRPAARGGAAARA